MTIQSLESEFDEMLNAVYSEGEAFRQPGIRQSKTFNGLHVTEAKAVLLKTVDRYVEEQGDTCMSVTPDTKCSSKCNLINQIFKGTPKESWYCLTHNRSYWPNRDTNSDGLDELVEEIFWHGFNIKAAKGSTVDFDPDDYVTQLNQRMLDTLLELIDQCVHPETGEMHRYLDEGELRKAAKDKLNHD